MRILLATEKLPIKVWLVALKYKTRSISLACELDPGPLHTPLFYNRTAFLLPLMIGDHGISS